MQQYINMAWLRTASPAQVKVARRIVRLFDAQSAILRRGLTRSSNRRLNELQRRIDQAVALLERLEAERAA